MTEPWLDRDRHLNVCMHWYLFIYFFGFCFCFLVVGGKGFINLWVKWTAFDIWYWKLVRLVPDIINIVNIYFLHSTGSWEPGEGKVFNFVFCWNRNRLTTWRQQVLDDRDLILGSHLNLDRDMQHNVSFPPEGLSA